MLFIHVILLWNVRGKGFLYYFMIIELYFQPILSQLLFRWFHLNNYWWILNEINVLPRLHRIDKSIWIGYVLSHIDIGNFYPNRNEKKVSVFFNMKK